MGTLISALAALALAFGHPAPPHSLAPYAKAGSISIPRLGIRAPLAMGTQAMYDDDVFAPELDKGVALYPKTCLVSKGRRCVKWLPMVLPWRKGVAAISGHRTTHTHPFRRLGRIRAGDLILLRTPGGVLRYRVTTSRIRPPMISLLQWHGRNPFRLILLTCNPPGLKTNRIVVYATRIKSGR